MNKKLSHPANNPNADYLLVVLEELAAASTKILNAGAAGDEPETRKAIDEMRQLRADLSTIGWDIKKQVDTAPQQTKVMIEKYLASIHQSDNFISAWCSRFNGIMTQEQLSKTPEGQHAIIDQVMPSTWDWNSDILILNDDVDAELIKAALSRGQQRIAVFCLSKPEAKQILPNVSYLTEQKATYAFFNSLGYGEPLRTTTFTAAHKVDIDPDNASEIKYAEFRDEFTIAWKHYIVNKNTIRHFSNRWLMQGLDNLSSIAEHPTLSSLVDRFIGTPLVVISPGPSLDKNVHLLKQLKGKALLMAPAQSALALSRAGIIPDIVVVADPADITYLVDGFPMEQVEALLIGVACHPLFYKKYPTKIITFTVNAGIDNWISDIFKDTAHSGAGSSVSTAIFTIALYLKCDPIILVGQDLALTNGKQYASKSADGSLTIKFNDEEKIFSYPIVPIGYEKLMSDGGHNSVSYREQIELLPGYYGGMVQTKKDYVMFHTEFENHAKNENKKDNPTKLFNCTEGGAFIEGFKHIPLIEAIATIDSLGQQTVDAKASIKKIRAALDVPSRKKLLLDRLYRVKSSLLKCQKLTIRCAQLALQQQKSTINIAALSKVEGDLAKAVQGSAFLALANQAEIQNSVQLGSRAKTLKQSLSASRILHTLLLREVPKVLLLVEAAITRLEQAHAHKL